jgi:hypothetical protein
MACKTGVMMAEPSTTVVAAFVAFVSGLLVGLFGFDWYALVGAGVGTGFAVLMTPPDGLVKWKVLAFAALSILFGAIFGTALVALTGHVQVRIVMMAACLVCAAGMQKILIATIGRTVATVGGTKP